MPVQVLCATVRVRHGGLPWARGGVGLREPEFADRLEAFEEQLRLFRVGVTARFESLQAELDELRRAPADAVPPAEPVESAPIERARQALEAGKWSEALVLAEKALDCARRDRDESARQEVVSLVGIVANSAPADLLPHTLDLANRAAAGAAEAVPPTAPQARPEPPPVAPPAHEEAPRAKPSRVPRLDLTDARVFALVGGIVTLLGIVFLFVLAASRGWIGPVARVSIGAVASTVAVAAGIALRMRFGRLQASLAAVGAGVAGEYATLAAATISYGLLATWVALLLAAAVAAAGGTLALRWSSQLLAGLSLVGAAVAPALVALDDGVGAAGTAFALVVLAASLAAAAPRRWVWLAATVVVVALAQVAWLVAEAPPNDAAAIAVVAAASLVLLETSLLWQVRVEELDQVAASLVLAGAGVAFGGVVALLPDNRAAGLALVAASAVYGGSALAVLRRFPLLSQVIGAAALLLAGIATAFLFSARSLTVAWAIEATILAALAWRIGSPRFEATALGYLAVGITHAFVVYARVDPASDDFPRSSAVGLFALAAAATIVGAFAIGEQSLERERPPSRLDPLWAGLVERRIVVRLWVWVAAAGLLALATAAAVSGSWLTIAWAAEATVLSLAAWRIASPHLGVAALANLTLGVGHAFAVDIAADAPSHDLPSSSSVGLYSLSGAALVGGILAVGLPVAWGSNTVLAGRLGVARGTIRLCLWVATVSLAAFATAAVLSGRSLTIAWAAAATALAIAAARLGERRLQAAALALLAGAAAHAVAVEVPPTTLFLQRHHDALTAVPSLVVLAGAAAALAPLSVFAGRGIAFLGDLEDAETRLAVLGRCAHTVRTVLALAATGLALWAGTLVLVAIDYEAGQCAATALWAATAVTTAAVAARRCSIPLAILATLPALLAYTKAVGFDFGNVGDRLAALSVLSGSAAVLIVGFCWRFAAAGAGRTATIAVGVTAVVATDTALTAVDLLTADTRVFGAGALAVAAACAALAVPPYRIWRKGDPRSWARNVATCYWTVGLAILVVAETTLVDSSLTKTAAVGAATGALVAAAARPLAETRLWVVGCIGTVVPTLLCLALRTPPSRLVVASERPGAGLWAFAVCVAALAWVGSRTPDVYRRVALPLVASAVALAVFGLSLGVLELVERVSSASIATDFERGHTVVSAVWGALALGAFVLGTTRGDRLVQRAGLVLFGLALAKLFLYDLSSLSSITRAFSFLAVGGIFLTAAFFAERLIHGGGSGGPRAAH